jgi:type III pantothenate kinase
MSILLMDVGNTRVKWARLENSRIGRQHAAVHAGWRASDYEKRLFPRKRAGIERIVVVSVAGSAVERKLTLAAKSACGVVPEFIRTRRSAGGLTTRYREPWRLGADRFVAAIGAHHLVPGRDVCVADVGTAMTLDLVDASGVHRGGAIVPGPSLMISSLLKDTRGIRRRAAGTGSGGGLHARDTRSAVEAGALFATAAVIERAVLEGGNLLGRKPLLILTGGAASGVRHLLRMPHRHVPNLVLRGLAHLA